MGRPAARGLTPVERDAAPAFAAWLDDFFASFYRHRPVTATFVGVHEHDHRLPDYSDGGVGDALADARVLLARLADLPSEPLSAEQRLDRRMAAGFLRTQLWEYASPHFRRSNPSLHTGEAIFGVIALLLQEQTPLDERLDRVTARLGAIPRLLAEARQSARGAPAAWIERARRECAAARILFGDGLDRYLAEHGREQAGPRVAADRAVAAFAAFDGYLEGALREASDRYACGAEAFGMLLREAHFLDLDAAGLEARALEGLERAEAALVEGAQRLGADSWPAALARLADVHPTAEQLPARFVALWAEARAAAEAHGLLSVPDWPVQFRPQPAWIKDAARSLYFIPYRSPAPLDLPPYGVQYVPTMPDGDPAAQERLLRAVNDQVIKQNYIVHHSGIGHHAQNWYAARSASRVGQVAAVDGASRIAMLCGGTLTEGWASYATDLMDEIEFLTPLESLAQVYARLRMATRAVVDVRLHEGRISLEEGARFYQERVGMAPSAARAEVAKNSLFPATGCMYLAGWDGIRRLRRAVEAREGSTFSLRRFHDRLLSYGSVPVTLVGETMLADGAEA